MAKALQMLMRGIIGSRDFHWWCITQNIIHPCSNACVTIDSATAFDLCVFISSVCRKLDCLFACKACSTKRTNVFIININVLLGFIQ